VFELVFVFISSGNIIEESEVLKQCLACPTCPTFEEKTLEVGQ
jgi:hypothetical protein